MDLQKIIFFSLFYTSTFSFKISTNCEWIGGSYGQQITCLPGWIAQGVCGSGRNADCGSLTNSYYFMLKCCQTDFNTEPDNGSYQIGFSSGTDQTCNTYGASSKTIDVVIGGCGSGYFNDCDIGRTSYTNIITCGKMENLKFGTTDLCAWRYDNYGQQIVCPSGYFLAGTCGSNSAGKCDKGAYTGAYCCPEMSE